MAEEKPGADEKYCSSCGEIIKKKAEICPSCGVRNTASTPTKEFSSPENTGFAALTHILAYFTWIIGPLLIYAATDDEYVKKNAANAFNWQLSFAIYMIISLFLSLILIGILFIFVLGAMDLIFCILAAVKASDGEAWDYPLSLNLL